MFNGLIARTPIYTRSLDLYGYELKFCSGLALQWGINDDDSRFGDSLARISRDIPLDDLIGHHRALIRPPTDVLPICEKLSWPRNRIVLALQEEAIRDVEMEKSVHELAARGYTIALHNPSRSLTELNGAIKRVTMCALDAGAGIPSPIADTTKRPQLLVRELKTIEQYDYFHRLGFDYYEGEYFTHPHLIHGLEIPANRIAVLQLLARLQDPNVEMAEVENLVSRDITLSYKLLRLINAAYFGMPKRVESIRKAVMFFGLQRVKNWATVILVNAVDFRPRELLTTAMVRARFCELLAMELGRSPTEPYYVAGLFSLLDAIMDAPMAPILERLNLSPELNDALLIGAGPIGEALRCVVAFERADVLNAPLREFPDVDFPVRAYLDAIRWASEANRQIVDA
ncbi:EAL and HDOD domain-containing protein [Methylococcus sp. EFPC2]|uniref:EAL and HDOD domain-containing protein n=1 Tax=Methylococcus sp. EFPC2 TaxID=2812648 RepID=UPI0019689EB0|nr:HDOD domain-containing protein [Methylococcus sp. EFPC2]QSA96212.1 HDOD domain-containing protein [Methylococcus sp. EFPC2]